MYPWVLSVCMPNCIIYPLNTLVFVTSVVFFQTAIEVGLLSSLIVFFMHICRLLEVFSLKKLLKVYI